MVELLWLVLQVSFLLLGIGAVWALIAAVGMGVGRMLRERSQGVPQTQEEWLRVAPVPAPGTLARARFNALPRDAAEARALGLDVPPLDPPSSREPKPHSRPAPGSIDGPPLITKVAGDVDLSACGVTTARWEGPRRPAQVGELTHDEKVRLLRAELAITPHGITAWHQIRAELAHLGEEV